MSFFAGDVMIECTEVSREAGQGICALCLEYAGLVTCNQHRPRVMPWRTRWSQSNTPESIGVLRIQCKYPSVQHMVPHSDMQSSSWILLKRDVRLKKIFFFFSPGKSCTSVHDWLHNFWQRRCLQNMRNSRRSKRGPTTLSDYNRHTDINTPCTQCLFTYLNTYKQEQTSFFFLTSSTLIAFF